MTTYTVLQRPDYVSDETYLTCVKELAAMPGRIARCRANIERTSLEHWRIDHGRKV
jgi:hypothetical protein